MKGLDESILCDRDQSFLLEIINHDHTSWSSISKALHARGIESNHEIVQYILSRFGAAKNDQGIYVIQNMTLEMVDLALKHKDRAYLTLKNYIAGELNQRPTNTNEVTQIAKQVGYKMLRQEATNYLYQIDYAPTFKNAEWIHDPQARINEISSALNSLNESVICNKEQSFLIEVMNYQHESYDSIQQALYQRGLTIFNGFIHYMLCKYGVFRGLDGIYAVKGLSHDLRDLANQHSDRLYYSEEQFTCDYAMEREGNCCINDIHEALTAEGQNNYYASDIKTIKSYLLKNGFIFEGAGAETKQTIYYRPNHCHNLIREAYTAFSQEADYHNHFAILLYYVSTQNISQQGLFALLEQEHGIPTSYTKKSIAALRLVKAKEGLRFPQGSNEAGRISRDLFNQITQNKKPVSIADYAWKLSQQGASDIQIQNILKERLTLNQVKKLLSNKRKYSAQKGSDSQNSDSGGNDTVQNALNNSLNSESSEKQTFEKFETDYMQRLKKHNQDIAKEIHKNLQKRYNQDISEIEQLTTPKQNFIYNPYQQKSLTTIFCEALENRFHQKQFGSNFIAMPLKTFEVSNILRSAKAEGRVIELFIPVQQTLSKTGTDAFTSTTKSTGRSSYGRTGGYSAPRGVVKSGPGFVPSMPMAGKVAGGYVGVFIVLPQVAKDLTVIASSQTEMSEKGMALFDLGFIAGSAWAFTKLIAKKHPKIAAAIMVGTAGKHILETGAEFYDDLENGKTKPTILFLNEQAMLEAGMSCIDGRKPEFLNPNARQFFQAQTLKK